MPIPFGVGVGDIVVVSKLIYRIGVELKKNSDSAADYQDLLIELEALNRSLTSLEDIKVAQHGRRRLDDFLKKIEKFESFLGPWNKTSHSVSSIAQRLRWSMKYKDEAKTLREKLSPKLTTITILLMAQTIETISSEKSDRFRMTQAMNNRISSQSQILIALKDSSGRVSCRQDNLLASQAHLTAEIAKQGRDLQTLKSQVDEVLKGDATLVMQSKLQNTLLQKVHENSVAMKVQAGENCILATSIQADVAEIKTSIPSVLGQALHLLDAVRKGISKMHDVLVLMRRMAKLMVRFTVEMRKTMGKLLRAFWVIQAQLNRMENSMSQRIGPLTVLFCDAFNFRRLFPFDMCQDWTKFQYLVEVAFTGQQGLHRVNMGQYFVTNARMGRRLYPTFWSNAIEPNDELLMTMVLNDVEADEGFCPYKSCGMSTASVPISKGGRVCPNCFRFAAMSQQKEAPSRSHNVGGTCIPRHSLPIRESELDYTPAVITNLVETTRRSQILHFKCPEVEDIELYHSIQVVQKVIHYLPSVSASELRAVGSTLTVLEHLAKFRDLQNRSSNSIPADSFDVTVKPLDQSTKILSDGVIVMKHLGTLNVEFTNRMDQPIFVYVYNLTPLRTMCSITTPRILYLPGKELIGTSEHKIRCPRDTCIELKMVVPPCLQDSNGAEIEDVIKIIITTKCVPFPKDILGNLDGECLDGIRGQADMVSEFFHELSLLDDCNKLRDSACISHGKWACRNIIVRTTFTDSIHDQPPTNN